MTWRNPKYAHLHAARDVGASAITADATIDTDFPVANLVDDQMQIPFKWSNAATDHDLVLDLLAGWETGLNRLFIPGHNITSGYVVDEADNPSMTSPYTLATGSMTSGVDLDITLNASSDRYIRITFAASGAWQLGQLWYSKTITTSRGPEPNWIDELLPNVEQLPRGTTLQSDPDQRFVEYRYVWLGSTDLTALEALVAAVSTHRPFLLDTAYEADDGGETLVVKLRSRARARNDGKAPASRPRRKRITLPMLEYLR